MLFQSVRLSTYFEHNASFIFMLQKTKPNTVKKSFQPLEILPKKIIFNLPCSLGSGGSNKRSQVSIATQRIL